MTKTLLILIGLLATVITAAGCTSAPQPQPKQDEIGKQTEAKNEFIVNPVLLECFIKSDKQIYTTTEYPIIAFMLKNNAGKPIRMESEYAEYCKVTINLINYNGKSYELHQGQNDLIPKGYRYLQPGESSATNYNIRKLEIKGIAELGKENIEPATYTVSAYYRGDNYCIYSNMITITVTK